MLKCKYCLRNFNESSLTKHEGNCQSLRKRRPFDSRKQRVRYDIRQVAKHVKLENKWKQKSDKLRAIIRLGRSLLN